jgi:hypothetical protein
VTETNVVNSIKQCSKMVQLLASGLPDDVLLATSKSIQDKIPSLFQKVSAVSIVVPSPSSAQPKSAAQSQSPQRRYSKDTLSKRSNGNLVSAGYSTHATTSASALNEGSEGSCEELDGESERWSRKDLKRYTAELLKIVDRKRRNSLRKRRSRSV